MEAQFLLIFFVSLGERESDGNYDSDFKILLDFVAAIVAE